jgi:hypothetical protein
LLAVVQVSAIGVWGDPLTLALRAADLVVALPPSQLSKSWEPMAGATASIHAKVLIVLNQAGLTLLRAPVEWASPFMSRDELQGKGLGLLLECGFGVSTKMQNCWHSTGLLEQEGLRCIRRYSTADAL